MHLTEPSALESFHNFVRKQLASQTSVEMSPEEALALWREEEETLVAIREGLDDVVTGRSKSLDEFDRDFRQRHGLEGMASDWKFASQDGLNATWMRF